MKRFEVEKHIFRREALAYQYSRLVSSESTKLDCTFLFSGFLIVLLIAAGFNYSTVSYDRQTVGVLYKIGPSNNFHLEIPKLFKVNIDSNSKVVIITDPNSEYSVLAKKAIQCECKVFSPCTTLELASSVGDFDKINEKVGNAVRSFPVRLWPTKIHPLRELFQRSAE